MTAGAQETPTLTHSCLSNTCWNEWQSNISPMPNPLPKVRRDSAGIHISEDDGPSDHRPEFALLAMKVISTWSIVEADMGAVFIRLLGANPGPATALFNAQITSRARMASISTVAKAVLDKPRLDALESILERAQVVAEARNKIAHWTWGWHEKIPNAVLLMNPTDQIPIFLRIHQVAGSEAERAAQLAAIGEEIATKIWVYRKSDFTQIIKSILDLGKEVVAFAESPGPGAFPPPP